MFLGTTATARIFISLVWTSPKYSELEERAAKPSNFTDPASISETAFRMKPKSGCLKTTTSPTCILSNHVNGLDNIKSPSCASGTILFP